jgi:hypothetical protein
MPIIDIYKYTIKSSNKPDRITITIDIDSSIIFSFFPSYSDRESAPRCCMRAACMDSTAVAVEVDCIEALAARIGLAVVDSTAYTEVVAAAAVVVVVASNAFATVVEEATFVAKAAREKPKNETAIVEAIATFAREGVETGAVEGIEARAGAS